MVLANSTDDATHISSVAPIIISLIGIAIIGLGIYAWVMRWKKKTFYGNTLMPPASVDTTVVVSDIADSSSMWEDIHPDVMDRAIGMHHGIIRRLLHSHRGYEQSTEGDSFILLFHCPIDALEYVHDVQHRFIEADWEPEVLQHPACVEQWTTMINFPYSRYLSRRRLSTSCSVDADAIKIVINDAPRNEMTRSIFECISYFFTRHAQPSIDVPEHAFPPAFPSVQNPITLRDFFRKAYSSDALKPNGNNMDETLVFRGIRVRMGMHSGVIESELVRDCADDRTVCLGAAVTMAKAVSDASIGGMVLMTRRCFERISIKTSEPNNNGAFMFCMGDYELNDKSLPSSITLFQTIKISLISRLHFFPPIRASSCSGMHLNVMNAPLGSVSVVFANVVGATTLISWDAELVKSAMTLFALHANHLLAEHDGYLIEMNLTGLCLAGFSRPIDAISWSVKLIEVMKMAAWDKRLLSHELCEEVMVVDDASPENACVVFRGPRLKIGIDVGECHSEVSPVTGRMTYRGKVMNRSARISAKAPSGTCWCSDAVWSGATQESTCQACFIGQPLGSFKLKGLPAIDMVQCSLRTKQLSRISEEDSKMFALFKLREASENCMRRPKEFELKDVVGVAGQACSVEDEDVSKAVRVR